MVEADPALLSNPLYRRFMTGEAMGYASPLGFSCRGCGHLCCVDTEVLVTPPEAARLIWYLRRHLELDAYPRDNGFQWGAMFLGGSSGLPVVQLNFIPLDKTKPDGSRHCPFLAPVYGANHRWLNMAWCAVRQARPGACRIYPVGRMIGQADPNQPENWQYRVVSRCPGFEAAQSGEAVPPGYVPPDPTKTIQDWVALQLDPEQEQERNVYLHEVVTAWMNAHLHAPTDDCPDGVLPEPLAMTIGASVLYAPPSPPRDPANDHRTIMEWLGFLQGSVPALEKSVQAILAEGSQSHNGDGAEGEEGA
jgi:Fe-S-cluster containining protein